MKTNYQNHRNLTVKQAVALAKKCFREEHHRRIPNNAAICVLQRYGGGRYVLIIGAGLTTEFYFN